MMAFPMNPLTLTLLVVIATFERDRLAGVRPRHRPGAGRLRGRDRVSPGNRRPRMSVRSRPGVTRRRHSECHLHHEGTGRGARLLILQKAHQTSRTDFQETAERMVLRSELHSFRCIPGRVVHFQSLETSDERLLN